MSQHFQTRDWKATDTAFLQGKQTNEIVVTGEIQTLNTSEHPELTEVAAPDGHAKTLVLDLKVPSSGIGGNIVMWKTVQFTKSLPGVHAVDAVEIKGAVEHTVKIKVHALQG